MDIIKVFGANVKRYRLAKGISQERLAEECKLHRTYISDIECNRRNVSLETVRRISEALEIEPHFLIMENHYEQSNHD